MKLSRRVFVTSSVSGLVAGSVQFRPDAFAAARRNQELRLGLVTYNWGREWGVPTIIRNCQESGFTGVELRSTHKHGVEITIDAKRREEVRKQFEDSDVELVGLGSACEYHAADPDVVKKNIEETKLFILLSRDVGGSGVKVRPNGLPADVPVEKTLEQIGRSLNLVGAFAADHGQQIRVEVHGRGTSEIPHMKTIMDVADHPNVAVCWNCNGADLNGEGLEHNYALLKDRMGTVHIHDLTGDAYPWAELFPLLKQTDSESFTGWTLLEDGRVPEDIVGTMKANRKRWEELAA